MTALPLRLLPVSAGFAALTAAHAEEGGRAALGAASALSALLGVPVELTGRALPEPAGPLAGVVQLPLRLQAVPCPAWLEVEASLASRLVDLLAGGAGELPPATGVTPAERAALELLALAALDGVAGTPGAARGLAPRLATSPDVPAPDRRALAVDLSLAAGPVRGRCRLLLPPEALRALGRPVPLPAAVAALPVEGLVSSGSTALRGEELRSLAPGDVLLLDEPPGPAATLRLPGLALRGRQEADHFILEESPVHDPALAQPLTLTVELARLSVPLGELARLEPGAALPLHAPRDGRVLLRLGDCPVAAGHLVEVDGALGVRIDRLEGAP